MGDLARLDVSDGVGTILLDRPKMNALDVQMQEEIRACAHEATDRDDVKAVVVYGGERVFAAGADVKEMAAMSYTDMIKRSRWLTSSVTAVAQIPKPTVSAITGYALGGGCELAMCTDIRIAADDAVLGQPEVLLGIIPGAGGTQRLTRLVGPARAKDIIFTGRFVNADEARADRTGRQGGPRGAGVRRGARVGGTVPQRRVVRAPGREGRDRPGPRGRPRHRAGDRARAVREPVRHRGPGRGHALVRRERAGQGRVQRRLMADQKADQKAGAVAGPSRKRGSAALTRVRLVAARVILLVFTFTAAMLALGALLVALRHNINADNPVVEAIIRFCDFVDGPFGRDTGIFKFHGKNEVAKEALVNWGIAALVYLLVGRLLDRVVRP